MNPYQMYNEFTACSGHGVVFFPNYPRAENAWCVARDWLAEHGCPDNYVLDFERLTIKFPEVEVPGQMDFRYVDSGPDIKTVHWSWCWPFRSVHVIRGERLDIYRLAGMAYRYMLDLDALTPWQAEYMLTRLRDGHGHACKAEGGQFDGVD